MSAKYKSPSFLLPNELNTSANPANDTGINSLYSMDFDGNVSKRSINLGIISEINGLTSFSISLWINPFFGTPLVSQLVFGNRDVSNSYRGVAFGLGVRASYTSNFYINSSTGTTAIVIPADTFTENAWNHTVFTYDGNTAIAYVNNVNVASSSVSGATLSSTGEFFIGRGYNATNLYAKGKIDEFAIFNRALNTTEISALYDGTGSNIRPSNLMATDLNPIAYYPLGEQAQNSGYPSATGNEWQFPNGVLQDYVMDFDGSNKINLGNSIGDIGTSPMTFSFWVNFAATSQIQTVLSNINSANNNGWKIEFSATGTSILFQNRDSGEFISCSYNLYDVWTNIIIVRNGMANNKIYINGQSQTLNTNTENLTNIVSTDDLVIGSQYYSNAYYRYFNGQMSNVAIWNTAITDAAQIANIYNNGSPQTTYTVTPQNWWKLNATSVYTPSAPNYTTALDFDNSPTFQGVIYSPTSLPSTSSWSVSFWAVSTGSTKQWLWSGVGAGIHIDNVNIRFTGTAAGDITMGLIPFSKGDLFHMLASYDGSTLKVYIDGSEFYSGSVTTNISTDYTTIGGWNRYGYPTGNVYYGYSQNDIMSNFAVWDSALTASQVSTIFNFGTPETNISFSPRNYYKLDNTTTGLNDLGSGGANAFISGTGITQVNSSIAVIPSWKIPSVLPITSTPNYTTALEFNFKDSIGFGNSIGSLIGDNYTGGLSFSFWINPSATISDDGVFNFLGDRLSFVVRGNSFRLYSPSCTSSQCFSYNYTNPNNEWSHCVISFLPSGSSFYLNGESVATWTYTDLNINGKDFYIGWYSSINYYYAGKLSNFQIWNTNLSSTEASTLYNGGTPIAALSGIPQSSNLISWWKLNDSGSTIIDSAGNNNGSYTSNSATLVASDVLTPQPVNGVSTTLPSTALQQSDLQFDSPYSNYSLYFDGALSRVQALYNLPSGVTKFSVSIWGNVEGAGSTANKCLISNENNTSADGYALFTEGAYPNTKVFFKIENNTSTQTTSNIVFGEWFHVLGTYDNGTAKIYFNGVLEDTTTGVPAINTSSLVSTMIGSYREASPIIPMLGNLDEAAIWDTVALTDAQVLQVYNNGKPNDISSLSPTNWWRLGENAYFNNGNKIVTPNSIIGGVDGIGSGTVNDSLSANAPGTYANGIGTNLDILDRVGEAPLSVANSQSYNMIPSDISPYVPQYAGDQIANNFSMTFDPASNTRFEVSSNSSFAFGTGDFTTSLWAYVTTYSSAPYLLDFRTGQNTGMAIYVDTNGRIQVYINGSTIIGSSGTVLSSGWHNIIIKRDNGLLSTHIDGGSADQSVSNSTNLGNSSNPLVIGARFNSTTQAWPDKIDEVAIFDTALNAGQIYNDIYQPTATGTNQTADLVKNPNLPNPVAWYRMGD